MLLFSHNINVIYICFMLKINIFATFFSFFSFRYVLDFFHFHLMCQRNIFYVYYFMRCGIEWYAVEIVRARNYVWWKRTIKIELNQFIFSWCFANSLIGFVWQKACRMEEVLWKVCSFCMVFLQFKFIKRRIIHCFLSARWLIHQQARNLK